MLGARIKQLRDSHDPKIEQADLARRAGVEPRTLWRIEHGKVENPGIKVVQAVARELGVTVDDLLNGPVAEPSAEPNESEPDDSDDAPTGEHRAVAR